VRNNNFQLSTAENVKEFKHLFEIDMFEINMKNLLSLGLALFTLQLATGQQEWCAASQLMQQKAQESPQMAQQLDAFIQRFEQFGKDYRSGALENDNRATEATGIYIPVVFHIIHNGDAEGTGENITEAQCLSQIDAMNKHFNGQDPLSASVPAPFQSLVANVGINFVWRSLIRTVIQLTASLAINFRMPLGMIKTRLMPP
jgi:hypothetical protein